MNTDAEDIAGVVSQTVDANDEAQTARLALLSNVIVLCLIEDLRGTDAILAALRVTENDPGGPTHVLVLSTTTTWANTKLLPSAASTSEVASSHRSLSRPVSMMAMTRRSPQSAGAGAGALPRASSFMGGFSPSRENNRPLGTASSKNSGRITRGGGPPGSSGFGRRRFPATPESALAEGDYLRRQPPVGYLEHKRLEDLALSLQQSAGINACVVGAGIPYGLGEGPLLRLFREAWRAGDAPVLLPTCTSGNNHLPLIHVVDLSVLVGRLLRPAECGASPAPFPKPYILAVEGGGSQCTAKELTEAIGRGFGGSGATRSMTEAELECTLIEDPAALSMLIDVCFSNDGGVLEDLVASGECWTHETLLYIQYKKLINKKRACRLRLDFYFSERGVFYTSSGVAVDQFSCLVQLVFLVAWVLSRSSALYRTSNVKQGNNTDRLEFTRL